MGFPSSQINRKDSYTLQSWENPHSARPNAVPESSAKLNEVGPSGKVMRFHNVWDSRARVAWVLVCEFFSVWGCGASVGVLRWGVRDFVLLISEHGCVVPCSVGVECFGGIRIFSLLIYGALPVRVPQRIGTSVCNDY